MIGYVIAVIAAVAAAVLQTAGLSALPLPLNFLSPLLLLTAAFVATFKPGQALAAAAVGGLTLDLLTSVPPGRNLVVMVVLAASLDWLFRRVFANLSYPSFAGLTAAGFFLLRLLQAAAAVMTAAPGGAASQVVWWPDRLTALTMALAFQVVISLFALLAARSIGRALTRRFLFAEHAS